jgi:hypothetical protein
MNRSQVIPHSLRASRPSDDRPYKLLIVFLNFS